MYTVQAKLSLGKQNKNIKDNGQMRIVDWSCLETWANSTDSTAFSIIVCLSAVLLLTFSMKFLTV